MHHSIKRVIQRTNINNERNAKIFIKNARTRGLPASFYADLPEFYEFLTRKSHPGKKIKIYKNYVFVLNTTNRTGTGCTTMYPIPKKFIDSVIKYEQEHTKTYCEFTICVPISLKTTVELKHNVKYTFKQVIKQYGDIKFCIKDNGTIEHNFKICGFWKTYIRYSIN